MMAVVYIRILNLASGKYLKLAEIVEREGVQSSNVASAFETRYKKGRVVGSLHDVIGFVAENTMLIDLFGK